jgi:predicted esterase YcpF (UPF0227 family)
MFPLTEQTMVWVILLVVVGFLIASAMPLIRQNIDEKKRLALTPSDRDHSLDSSSNMAAPSRALIYIHGFRSSPLSEKSRALQAVFPDITLASYDTMHPDTGYQQLDDIVRAQLFCRPVLVGSSLGGFWSYQFAKKYALKCVLLNPCMHPEVTLKPCIGPVENMYTGERGVLEERDLLQYDRYRLKGEAECVVLHEKGDELIPYRESVANFEGKAKLILIEGGSHSFEHLEMAIGEIRSLLASE